MWVFGRCGSRRCSAIEGSGVGHEPSFVRWRTTAWGRYGELCIPTLSRYALVDEQWQCGHVEAHMLGLAGPVQKGPRQGLQRRCGIAPGPQRLVLQAGQFGLRCVLQMGQLSGALARCGGRQLSLHIDQRGIHCGQRRLQLGNAGLTLLTRRVLRIPLQLGCQPRVVAPGGGWLLFLEARLHASLRANQRPGFGVLVGGGAWRCGRSRWDGHSGRFLSGGHGCLVLA